MSNILPIVAILLVFNIFCILLELLTRENFANGNNISCEFWYEKSQTSLFNDVFSLYGISIVRSLFVNSTLGNFLYDLLIINISLKYIFYVFIEIYNYKKYGKFIKSKKTIQGKLFFNIPIFFIVMIWYLKIFGIKEYFLEIALKVFMTIPVIYFIFAIIFYITKDLIRYIKKRNK